MNPSSNNKVTIFWTDKLHPDNCTREICSATAKTVSEQPVEPASSAPTILATINPYRFHKFAFNISSTVVPDKFWFEVEDSAVGDEPFIGDNGGQGFTRVECVASSSVFLVSMSLIPCFSSNFDVFLDSAKTLEAATNDSLVFVVAVRPVFARLVQIF